MKNPFQIWLDLHQRENQNMGLDGAECLSVASDICWMRPEFAVSWQMDSVHLPGE